MRCNAAATRDKVQLPASTVELPGQGGSETISAHQSGTQLYYGLKVLEEVMS
jgi:hypothetical protein